MQSFERIRDIVHDVTGVPSELITADSTAEQLSLDSLDITEVVLSIEEEFDIIVEDEGSINTIADLIRCVESAA